jgi:RimJ/RimL family protein N-acetyltransferase
MTSLTQPNYPVRTERLALRPIHSDDLDAVHAYRSMPDIALYLPHAAYARGDTKRMIAAMIEQASMAAPGDWLDLAVELESGHAVGEVLLKRNPGESHTGEVGFVFHPSVHGTGVATEAVGVALQIAFEDFGWHRLVGICDLRNVHSAALMERLGMRREAVLWDAQRVKGRWTTTTHYAILQAEWRALREHDGPGRSSDKRLIDEIVATFFATFVSADGTPTDLTVLHDAVLPDALIVKATQDGPECSDLDGFIAPRSVLLNGGHLSGFREYEVLETTEIFGDLAQRWSMYRKEGVLDGASNAGWGCKSFQFARTPDGWRISAIAWADGRAGATIPTL